jgi:hypothetical protein
MIKLYIDDVRIAPEGWHQVWNIGDALEFIEANHADISHIDFDYYLNENMPKHTGAMLIRQIIRLGLDVFHQPIENYTFHSSDSEMNDQMRNMVAMEFDALLLPYNVEYKTVPKPLSGLQRLRNNKGRR